MDAREHQGISTPSKIESAQIVVLTSDQLATLVESAVARALDRFVATQPAPARLLKSSEMAALLQVCESQLTTLCREGCPHSMVGDRIRRFEPAAVFAWLAGRASTSLSAG